MGSGGGGEGRTNAAVFWIRALSCRPRAVGVMERRIREVRHPLVVILVESAPGIVVIAGGRSVFVPHGRVLYSMVPIYCGR